MVDNSDLIVMIPLFFYIINCFHYAYHQENTWRIHCRSLFEAVWSTIPLMLVAFIFWGITKALIYLANILLITIGENFIQVLRIDNGNVSFILNSFLIFAALGIAKQSVKTIHALQFILLNIFRYLFPFLAIITILFFFFYLWHHQSTNWR